MATLICDERSYAPFTLMEYEHAPGSYCLMLPDGRMGPTLDVFAAGGREGGGYAWADVALQLMRGGAPELEARLGMDPEAGMFVACGRDLEALRRLGELLRAAFHDHEQLAALVRDAPFEYD